MLFIPMVCYFQTHRVSVKSQRDNRLLMTFHHYVSHCLSYTVKSELCYIICYILTQGKLPDSKAQSC